MKVLKKTMIAGAVFFISTGISYAADMDDLDVTIRMVESNDVHEMENELTLPESASDTAREHAESEDSQGLTQANESQDREHDGDATPDSEQESSDQAREQHEDEMEHADETADSHDTASEERDDARDEEQHEQEEEQQQQEEAQDTQPDSTEMTESPNDGSVQ